MRLNTDIVSLIYDFIPVTHEDMLLNNLVNILTAKSTSVVNMLTNNSVYSETWRFVVCGKYTVLLNCDNFQEVGCFNMSLAQINGNEYFFSDHMLSLEPAILARRLVRLAKQLSDVLKTESPQLLTFESAFTVSDRFAATREEVLEAVCDVKPTVGITLMLKQEFPSLFCKTLAHLLEQTVEHRNKTFVQAKVVHFNLFRQRRVPPASTYLAQFPLTIANAETVIHELGLKKINRSFRYRFMKGLKFNETHICVGGVVGNGNSGFAHLKLPGFFNLLIRRCSTKKMKEAFRRLQVRVYQLICKLNNTRLYMSEFDCFSSVIKDAVASSLS
jgi:hypothetical protein